MTPKGSEFHVKLDGIKFSPEVEKRIEVGIQGLILEELAGYKPHWDDPKGNGTPIGPLGPDPIVILKPKPWPGFICIKVQGPSLDTISKDINQVINEIGGR